MMKINFLLFITLATSICSYAQEPVPAKKAIKRTSYLKDDVVTIPLVIVSDWPFIKGEINKSKGKWMFDTGNGAAFALHSKRVSGVESKKTGNGFVGSGQKFEIVEYALIDQIKIGRNVYDTLKNVRGNDYYFLEEITPDVIGQVGFAFFEGYDMKLDYPEKELTFYKQKEGLENWSDIKKDKRYITSLPYFTRRHENIPIIKICHKGIDLLLVVDTGGGKGTFMLEEYNFKNLTGQGDIESFSPKHDQLYNWRNIKIDDRLTVSLHGLEKEDSNPAHKSLQIDEKNTLTLAHSFLSQYVTLWDTRNKIIHVLKKE